MIRTGNQFYATFCANLLCLSYGLATGWTSAAIPLLLSPETPLKSGMITKEEASFIGSVLTIGGVVGTLLFGYAANKIGLKRAIFLMAFPQIIGWIFLYYAEGAMMLIIFRFTAGLSAGGVLTVVSGYTSEISADKVRGLLGSTLRLFFCVGIMVAYIFGAVLPYRVVPLASIPFSLVFLYGFWNVPETPLFLLKNQKHEEAQNSIRYYRYHKNPKDIEEALDMKIAMESLNTAIEKDESSKFEWRELLDKQPRKVIMYGIVLMALNQFCGCFPMMNFTATIFNESGSNLPSNISSIIVGAVQILGAISCTFLVEKAGRKVLVSISAFGISLGLLIMSCYTYLTTLGYDTSGFSWIPLAAFSFVMCVYNWGVNTLPFLYVSEIVQIRYKPFTMMFCLSMLFIFSTIVIQLLSTMINRLGMHGTMLVFAFNSMLGGILVSTLFPETKGKSYDQILLKLGCEKKQKISKVMPKS